MARIHDEEMEYDDTDEDEPSDADWDVEEDSAGDVLPCPSCGREIFHDTDRCPHCGDWVMPLSAAAGPRKTWVWWTALVLLGALLVSWGLTC